jgi:hypothetical protein
MPWQTRSIAFQCNRLKGSCCLRGNPLSDDVDSALGSLHHVDAVSIANVSEAYSASIFRVEVNKVGEFEHK